MYDQNNHSFRTHLWYKFVQSSFIPEASQLEHVITCSPLEHFSQCQVIDNSITNSF